MRDLIHAPCALWMSLVLLAKSLGPCMRALKGNWHVFRDSPYWVVKHWAQEHPNPSPAMAAIIQQAKDELELRLRQRAWLIKQQIESARERSE